MPDAHLAWAYGMLGAPMMPSICRAVDRCIHETGDRRVSVCRLSAMTERTAGARSHPGKKAHKQAAKELAAFLRPLLANGR